MIGQLLLNGMFCVCQAIVLVFSLLALCTSQWIRQVSTDDEDDRYFIRLSADTSIDQTVIFQSADDELESVGLWRMWATGSASYPLPIVG